MVINSFSLPKDREQALQAFGYLFELYVDRLMREIYPASSNVFFSFSKFQNGDEAFDGVLCLGEHLIVMEYKGGLLKEEAKYGGKLKALEADMDKKFGTGPHGGVRQIVKKLERLFHANPVKRDRVAQIDRLLPRITKITPVLVVQEPFFRFDFLNEILNQGFGRLMKKGKLKPIEIALNIGEGEKLAGIKVLDAGGDPNRGRRNEMKTPTAFGLLAQGCRVCEVNVRQRHLP